MTMWNKIAEDSRKEEKLQIKETEEELELMAGASGSRKVDDGQTEPKEKAEYERSMVTSILRTILDELSKVGGDITDLMKIFDETADDEQLSRELNVKFVVVGNLDIEQEKVAPIPPQSADVRHVEIAGENVEAAAAVMGSEVILSEVVRSESEVVGHKSKLSVGKYIMKSKVRDGREKRVWPCPYGDCEEKFRSSRKCGAHLNEHLNRIYECPKCKYRSYSVDGYEHHICFKGPKTQGKRKVREKWKMMPEPEGGSKEETGGDMYSVKTTGV